MGKLLILSFDESEEGILNEILTFLSTVGDAYEPEEFLIQRKLIFQEVIIDLDHRRIYRNNNEIELTFLEFEILQLLARHPGKIFSKEIIYNTVWKEQYVGDYEIVTSHISNIRKKIEDNPSKPMYIQTARGIGYRFNSSK